MSSEAVPNEYADAFRAFGKAIEKAKLSIAQLLDALEIVDNDDVLSSEIVLEDILDAEILED